jgi:hypothetical protein
MHPTLTIVTAAGLFGLSAGPASAELIEFTFEGELDLVEGTPPPPWEGTEVGSTFSMRYVFDSEAEDHFGDPSTGLYDIEAIWMGLDGIELPAIGNFIEVNLADFPPFHMYFVSFTGLPQGGNGNIALFGHDVFETDALPTDLDLADFDWSRRLEWLGIGWELRGDVLSFERRIVPTPSTLLVVLLLGGRSGRRRRRAGVTHRGPGVSRNPC